jgi:hypothetical protein
MTLKVLQGRPIMTSSCLSITKGVAAKGDDVDNYVDRKDNVNGKCGTQCVLVVTHTEEDKYFKDFSSFYTQKFLDSTAGTIKNVT